ncbi:MAG: hypothetical protein K0S07_700 [Chlamydiales bacterium]|jgi:hypothetical protein|nr:hypothetical protein [Chlamydiales bacterium]
MPCSSKHKPEPKKGSCKAASAEKGVHTLQPKKSCCSTDSAEKVPTPAQKPEAKKSCCSAPSEKAVHMLQPKKSCCSIDSAEKAPVPVPAPVQKPEVEKSCCSAPSEKAAIAVTSTAVAKACCHSLVAAPKAPESCGAKTHITVKYNAGFPNNLFIRGSGGGLSWERGIPLKNIGDSEWVFESQGDCKQIEFKVLLNDLVYEQGPNHVVEKGKQISYAPTF